MTKIQKQRNLFWQNIDLSTWVGDSKEYIGSVSGHFSRYHYVIFDYFSIKDYEQFTKKWWIKVIGSDQYSIPLKEEKINMQKSNFSINYEKAALIIVDKVKYNLEIEFNDLERRARY